MQCGNKMTNAYNTDIGRFSKTNSLRCILNVIIIIIKSERHDNVIV